MELENSNQSWLCGLAWHGLSVQANGGVRPCCRYSIVHEMDSPEEPENSLGLQLLRKEMLEGKVPAGCNRCFQDEAVGIRSKRQRSLKRFSTDQIPDLSVQAKEIQVMEYSVGNLCNARCLMCSPHLSSAWNMDAGRLGYQKSPLLLGEESRILQHLPHLQELEIIGGETFLGDRLERLLLAICEKGVSQNISLKLVTNLSIFPKSEVLQLLSKFQRVEIYGSVDGFKETNTFVRYPTRWQDVDENLRKFLAWASPLKNVHISLSHTASALTLASLPDLLDWWGNILREFSIHSVEDRFWFNGVIDPDYQAVTVLPLNEREKIVAKLTESSNELAKLVLRSSNYLLAPQKTELLPDLQKMLSQFQYRSSIPVASLFPEVFAADSGLPPAVLDNADKNLPPKEFYRF